MRRQAWLRLLSRWVGPTGRVVATDVDAQMLEAAAALCAEETLTNVDLVQDDVFTTALLAAEFDLVHLPFQLTPLGRAPEQVALARRLALEEPDVGS